MSDGPLVLNGRVAGRAQITGVERWAVEVIPRLLAMRPDRYRILDPPDGFDSRAGQAWEQFVLPAVAARMRAALVWSPANLAPWLWPRNVVVLHDAAVLRNTSGYSRAYRAWHVGFGTACARRALAVVTVSEFSRRELVNLGGLDPEKVVVIPGGVDSRFHGEVDAERVGERYALRRPYVVTVGTDDPRKNLAALDHTAQQLQDLGFDLVWAGSGKRHISNGTAVSGLRALGYVPDEDLPGLYAGARAFVLPSRYEGFGLTCLEAMACGTPVVAADRAALPETCGDAALLVDPDDPAEVAAAVIRAATDPGVRVRLRHAGFRRATEATWEAAAARTDTLLMQLADQ
jgi:glycosyltransferase involved in cell wall biosynthesis